MAERPDYTTIRRRIRSYRLRCGMRQEDVAEKLNTTSQYVSRIENNGPISLNLLFTLADIFSCTVCDFLASGPGNSDEYLSHEIESKLLGCTPGQRKKVLKIVDILVSKDEPEDEKTE